MTRHMFLVIGLLMLPGGRVLGNALHNRLVFLAVTGFGGIFIMCDIAATIFIKIIQSGREPPGFHVLNDETGRDRTK